jgi:hypothetical protein
MVWLILGTGQLTYIIAFLTYYQFPLIPPAYGYDEPVLYWFLPRLVATLACGVAVIRLRGIWGWQGLYGVALVVLAIVTLDAQASHQHRLREESLFTLVGPYVLALFGGAAVLISMATTYPGWPRRRLAHWCGIAMAFVPLAWFLFGMAHGWVVSRELLVRIRE